MKLNLFRYAFFSLLILILFGTPCYAHKAKMFASAEGEPITGYVYYTTGGKPQRATVLVKDQSGNRLGEVTTDENGEFTFTAETRQDYIFILELADGHRATFTLTAGELPDSLPPADETAIVSPKSELRVDKEEKPPSSDEQLSPQEAREAQISAEKLEKIVDKAVSKQIRPLREQLEQYEEKIRLHDILGGIGYIVGLMGLGYFLSVRKKR